MPSPLYLVLPLLPLTLACQRDWSSLHARIAHNAASNPFSKRSSPVYPPPLTDIESQLLNSFDSTSLSSWSSYYTHGDHLGSHNISMAEWTAEKWKQAGLDEVKIVEYPIWYTYPQKSELRLLRVDGSVHEARLVEDVLVEDETSGYPGLIPAYHAMSASGNVKGEFVYVG